jgi:4-amino-4-deoxy-L-arabinose transferase-like glycosyltransferase
MAGDAQVRDASALARLTVLVKSRPLVFEGAALLVGLAVFLISVLPNLGNHPSVTDDEVWVLSASYKLATQGVFGSDIFQGFYNADRQYFFNMPAQQFVIAGALKVLGYGIAQARLVGVLYGGATLLLTHLLARRVYGVATAVMSLALLLFLRLNMGFDTGLPLQELSASIRYDLAPVPFVLAGCLVLLGGPSVRRSLIAGALFGLATLLQFYGAFIVPVAVVFLWTERRVLTPPLENLRGGTDATPLQSLERGSDGPFASLTRWRLKLIGALVGAALVVCVPYGLYALAHYDDFKGQAGTIDKRGDFNKPGFYVDNLIDERHRFLRPLGFKEVPRGEDPQLVPARYLSLHEMVTRRPSARLGVLVGVPLALGFLAMQTLREGSRGDRLLLLCLGGLVLQFALLESAKFYIYWIPVVPFLCIGIAAACMHLLRPRMWQGRGRLIAGATALVLLLCFAEGSVARLSGLRVSQDAGNYDQLAAAIHEQIPPGSRVVGATSMWWGLRDTDYRSYFLFFYLTREDAGEYRKTLSGFLSEFKPQYLVLTRIAGQELDKHLAPAENAAWQAYLKDHGTKLRRIEGPLARGYGYVDVWKLQ